MDISSPIDVVEAVRRCRVVVTGAYHAAVFALSQGIPVVCLSRSEYYDAKFLGLADMFGLGCELVRWDSMSFERDLEFAIATMWETAAELRLSLLSAAEQQCQLANDSYGILASRLQSLSARTSKVLETSIAS
jgi:colanic acid/amylovoran biosynthesis protein